MNVEPPFPFPFLEDHILGMFSEPFLSVAPNSHVSHSIYLPVCLSACLASSIATDTDWLACSIRLVTIDYYLLPCPLVCLALEQDLCRLQPQYRHSYIIHTIVQLDCIPHTALIHTVYIHAYRSYPTSCQHPLSLSHHHHPPPPPKKASLSPLSPPLPPPPPASLVSSREHTKLSLSSFAVLRTAHEIPSFPSLACSSRRTVRIFPIAYFPIFFSFLSLHAHLIAVRTYIHTLLYSSTLYSCACWL